MAKPVREFFCRELELELFSIGMMPSAYFTVSVEDLFFSYFLFMFSFFIFDASTQSKVVKFTTGNDFNI